MKSPTLEKYAKALLARAKSADELKAMTLFNEAYKKTGSFRFRKQAGEIQVSRARRALEKIRAAAAANLEDAEAQDKLKRAEAQFDKLKLEAEHAWKAFQNSVKYFRSHFE